MTNFLSKIKLSFNKATRVKRNVLGFILQNILKAAEMLGFSEIGIFAEPIPVHKILQLIGNSLQFIGHYNKVVTLQEKKAFVDTNLTRVIKGNSDYLQIMPTYLLVNHHEELNKIQIWLMDSAID